ncbi:MAG: transposase [Chloroflexota bacterium]
MIHKPRRKNSLRLKGWNYRAAGYYFLTFCSHNREQLFEKDPITSYLAQTWERIPTWKNMAHFQTDAFVIMPNHIHAILWITTSDVTADTPASPKVEPGSAGAAVGTFKSTTTRQLRGKHNFSPDLAVWQRGYYDRIIRDEAELNRIREYIDLNPVRWAENRDNYDELLSKMNYHPD